MLPSIRLQLWRRFQLQSLTIRSPFWHNSGSSVFCLFVTEATQFWFLVNAVEFDLPLELSNPCIFHFLIEFHDTDQMC